MTESGQSVQFEAQDVEKNKVFAIVGYIFPILFFVPLVTDAKESLYAKFHANQQLILLIFGFAGGFVINTLTFSFAFIPFLGVIMRMLLLPVFWIACLGYAVMGVINASKGAAKKLPVIGELATIIR